MATFHTDLPNVMHEMIDDEVVVVNLDSGTYYSFDGVGGQIWQLLGNGGGSLAALEAQLAARYDGDPAQMADAVARFVARLRDEGLVRVDDGAADATPAPVAAGDGERLAFTEPELQKYTDMEALLLADPIHEVDEGGWPNLK